jgi:hypothetical protein
MTVHDPQQVKAFLTPEQIKALQERYQTEKPGDALAALLLMAAGALVLAKLASNEKPKPKRRRRA